MSSQLIPLEEKEIRGINAKQLFWLFGGLMSILISVLATYFSMVNKLENSQKAIDDLVKYNQGIELRLKDIESRQQNTEIKFLTLQVQLEEKGIIQLK